MPSKPWRKPNYTKTSEDEPLPFQVFPIFRVFGVFRGLKALFRGCSATEWLLYFYIREMGELSHIHVGRDDFWLGLVGNGAAGRCEPVRPPLPARWRDGETPLQGSVVKSQGMTLSAFNGINNKQPKPVGTTLKSLP